LCVVRYGSVRRAVRRSRLCRWVWSTNLANEETLAHLGEWRQKKYFNHCSGGMQYLDYRVGIVFLCSRGLPEEGTLVPQHVGVWCLSCIVFYCVLGAFVGWYTDWKKKICMLRFKISKPCNPEYKRQNQINKRDLQISNLFFLFRECLIAKSAACPKLTNNLTIFISFHVNY
jgi:hypothetical protein